MQPFGSIKGINMCPVSSSRSCPPHPVNGGIVGWSVDSKTVEIALSAVVPRAITTAPNLTSLLASYLVKQRGVFADNDWNELCGEVAPAPPLPLNIEEIWEGRDPFSPRKKVKYTHVLVYLPTRVGDKALTLKTIGEIAKRTFANSDEGYDYIWYMLQSQISDQPVATAGWVLMRKNVIKGSRKKSYADQQAMIVEIAKRKGVAYAVPTTLQATICILTHYMRTGKRLFSDTPLTFTRCQENFVGYQSVVGGFSQSGLRINPNTDNWDYIGVAAVIDTWKLGS